MKAIADQFRAALAHQHLGECAYRRGDRAQAKAHLRAALKYFYVQSSATFRAADSMRLFGRLLVEEDHRQAGLELLFFALKQAEERDLVHVEARTRVALAETLLEGPGLGEHEVKQHLEAASALAEKHRYQDISRRVAQLRETMRQSVLES